MKKIHRTAHASRRALPRAFALALALALLLASCSKSAGAAYGGSASTSFAAKEMAWDDADMAMADYDEEPVDSSFTGTGYTPEAPVPAPSEPKQAFGRKLIRTGSIRLEVDSLAEVKGSVGQWVKKYGGYVANSDEGSSSVSFTVKIPSARFDEAMGETSSFGKVLNKQIGSQDVTERYYDLKTRLETKRVMQERLENYLKSAKDVKDMLEIESQLNNVTADLEAMQGQLNRLSSQVDFSEITVFARLRPNYTERGFTMPDVGSKFNALASNVIGFFVGLLFVLIYVVIFGIPIVLVLALLYWLCFGRIGLVRKLFARLRKQ